VRLNEGKMKSGNDGSVEGRWKKVMETYSSV